MDYSWIIHGLSMDYQWMSMDNPWTSLDFRGVPGAGGTGRPCWGNRPARSGGTAAPQYFNAFIIQKVRTPSGKPGWGTSLKITMGEACAMEANRKGQNEFLYHIGERILSCGSRFRETSPQHDDNMCRTFLTIARTMCRSMCEFFCAGTGIHHSIRFSKT